MTRRNLQKKDSSLNDRKKKKREKNVKQREKEERKKLLINVTYGYAKNISKRRLDRNEVSIRRLHVEICLLSVRFQRKYMYI